jgi:GrpB-like predicted nucleotidyltransferase (UPF0157 family)
MSAVPSIEIVDYDPAWPGLAAAAITELENTLAGVFSAIEHIGSTAVPGLAAKPVIDLMAAVPELSSFAQQEGPLAGIGFLRHENGMSDRLLYVREQDAARACILHVVTLASWPTRNQRILRDYLREHPADALRYGALKREIVAAGVRPGDYAGKKTALIQELTDRARTKLGLPLVDVWEK